MGKLTILTSGLHTSIQDMGRYGFRQYGIPISGAMDQDNARLANLLVNNPYNHPVIEITQIGPKILFHDQALIAIAGADLSPTINSEPIANNKALQIEANDILSFGKPKHGVRAYLAIHGLQADKVLGSYSQYKGITEADQLMKEDTLSFDSYASTDNQNGRIKLTITQLEFIEVVPGIEFGLIPKKTMNQLLSTPLLIKANNRMGYQLESPVDLSHNHTMITSPVVPGTTQLTPSGELLVLMRDGQVTGGYPRVFQLTEQSINQLAQKNTGDQICLKLIKRY